jgi:hypothetical protein
LDSQRPGDDFVLFVLLAIIFSCVTPWPWFQDVTFLVIVMIIGTVMNAIKSHER